MTILVTGAGLIAAHVAKLLQEHDKKVVIYDLAPSMEYLGTVLDVEQIQVFGGDITSLPEIASVVRSQNVTTIVHTAGLIGASVARHPYRGVEVNIGGTVAVVEAARLANVQRIVFCSSMAIYDFSQLPSKAFITENSPVGPANLYGATKLACEHLLTQYGQIYDIDVVHLRLAGVFGRGRYMGGSWMGRILDRLLETAIRNEELTIRPEWFGANEYVYVKDVAQACTLACLSQVDIGASYNIGTGIIHTFEDFIWELRQLVPAAKINVTAVDSPLVSYLARDQAFDITRAKERLGYKPRYSFQTGLRDYLEELRMFAGQYDKLA